MTSYLVHIENRGQWYAGADLGGIVLTGAREEARRIDGWPAACERRDMLVRRLRLARRAVKIVSVEGAA